MNEITEKYFRIELAGLPKAARNQLHLQLINDLTKSDVSFEDISFLLSEANRQNITVRQPFFEQIIYPVLEKEISRDNLRALKHLIKLNQNLLQLQRRRNIYDPSKRQLILAGLKINPEDRELLEMYEFDLRNSLRFAIHEVPHGVLYGMDGATEDECDILLEMLESYKKVCEKLSLDRNDLIEESSFHFHHYKMYLQAQLASTSYEKFLANYAK